MAVPVTGGDQRGDQDSPAPVHQRGPVVARVRVVVAEDDVLLREGLASLLDRSGFDVVGQAGDGVQLLGLVREQAPELVVTDIRMPPTHSTEGLDAARVIREELPGTAILVLSAHVEVEHAMGLLASGRSVGYLLKSRVTDVADFVETLGRIAKGASVVDPALVAELVSARRRNDPLEVLSAREREVLALMAEGRSNAGIAHRIWVRSAVHLRRKPDPHQPAGRVDPQRRGLSRDHTPAAGTPGRSDRRPHRRPDSRRRLPAGGRGIHPRRAAQRAE
jgi:serine/threonine-protein kinase PknK